MTRNAKIALLRILILAAALVVAWMLSGCINIVERTEKPYFVAPCPYNCTAEVGDMLGVPFRESSNDPIGDAFVTLTWPIWLVDLPCEAVLDTVFLPADALVKWVRDRSISWRHENEKKTADKQKICLSDSQNPKNRNNER